MLALIFLMASQPVSGQIQGAESVTGVVGRAVTVECRYERGRYSKQVKYWCQGSHHFTCTVLARTSDKQPGHQGRVSIADNKADGVLTITMEKLQADDSGQYWCGVQTVGLDPHFSVRLQIQDVPVSKPIVRLLNPLGASCSGQTVSISCESTRGSLPISYSWHQTSLNATDPRISDNGNLTLGCGNVGQGHGYYCSARNGEGSQSGDSLQVSVWKTGPENCVYVVQIQSEGNNYSCEDGLAISSLNTVGHQSYSKSKVIYCVLCTLGILGIVLIISGIFYKTRRKTGERQVKPRDTQENAQVSNTGEDSVTYVMVQRVPKPSEEDTEGYRAWPDSGEDINYATVKFESRRTAEGSGEATAKV